jgi:dienelactone hydrolase
MTTIALLLVLAQDPLAGTRPLREERDLADLMMDGLHRWVERKIGESVEGRARFWKDPAAGDPRKRLLKILGAVDPRVAPRLERFGDDAVPALLVDGPETRVWQVRWSVLEGVTAEGLYLEPKGEPKAHVVALPDADRTPESLASSLTLSGCAVLVPTLVSRDFEFSGDARVGWTNQSHREWIYRQAYQMGRHVLGYEVQKVLAAVDLFRSRGAAKIGVAGWGEGGLVALYAAAADPRIDAALVSGAFEPFEDSWKQPLYRNVWSLLRGFGGAELGAMARGLVVEAADYPEVGDPAKPPQGRRPGAAVGRLGAPAFEAVKAEFDRMGPGPRKLVREGGLREFAALLGVESGAAAAVPARIDARDRQRRQVKELEAHVQGLLRNADRTRNAAFLDTTTLLKTMPSRGERFRTYRVPTRDAETFAREAEPFRKRFWEEVLGKIEDPLPDPDPRTRKVYDRETWTGWDVVLDAAPEFFAWGVLLLPKDLRPGERRPVVVCQHGRNGLPKDTIEGDTWAYHDYAAKLAERGFVVFSPHNPYRGEDKYRLLSRKANLVGGSLFSFILHQHRQILAWLKAQPFVDPARIAFYGLSYGGETAVRVPPVLTDYALSICSGDFNDWARKVAATDSDYSFMYSIEWEMPYFDLGSTFNYAEMAYLMVPRPFMVERGHHDGVAPDEWVNSEYAKVRWLYAQLGLSGRTAIDHYNGGHTINGEATFEFLHRHLDWPKR